MYNKEVKKQLTMSLISDELGQQWRCGTGETVTCRFTLNPFDKRLIGAGGWLAYADAKY